METTTTHGDIGGIEVNATIIGHSKIDFDKRIIRKVLRKEGGEVRKIARRLVARRGISSPGDFPGRDSGALFRSIKSKVSSGGFWVKIAPQKTAEMGKDFYPAFLFYGTPRMAKRANYMIEALDQRRAPARAAIRAGLDSAIKPR